MRNFKKVVSTLAAAGLMAAASIAMAAPPKATIDWMADKYPTGSSVLVKWSKWWGEGATSWTLNNQTGKLCEGTLTPADAQNGECTITVPDGIHDLTVTLKNSTGSSVSDPKSITVGDPGTVVDPTKVTSTYVLTSEWPGGRVINISVEGADVWEAVVKYNAPVELHSIWAGTATLAGNTITFKPDEMGKVQAQLLNAGRAMPSASYIQVGTHQIPFTNMPEPPAPVLDTYYLDPAKYMPTGTIKIGQAELPNVWAAGPMSMMIPNERIRWAMGLAHASQLFKNVSGIDDVYNGVNHFQATIIQESRFGADPQTPSFTYDFPAPYPIVYQSLAAKDGFYQIEGATAGGSAYGDLVRVYPNRLANRSHTDIVSNDNFETASIAAAYYNLFSYYYLVGKGYTPKDFISKAKDPQALDRIISMMYNRGVYYPFVDSLFTTERTRCVNELSLADDAGICMPNDGNYGALYVRQVPGFGKALIDATAGGAGNYPGYFEATVVWADVADYLDRLTVLYGADMIATAKAEAQKAFNAEAGTGTTITFSTQFGKVLDTIMMVLPVDSPQNQLCQIFGKCEVEL